MKSDEVIITLRIKVPRRMSELIHTGLLAFVRRYALKDHARIEQHERLQIVYQAEGVDGVAWLRKRIDKGNEK